MSATTIEWTDVTWNVVTGCDRTSPGCDNCYALRLARRLKAMGNPRYQADGDPRTSGPGFGVTLHPDKLEEPERWLSPRRVFVNSMSDLLHPDVPLDFIADVWATMAHCPQHTFQILTKRAQRWPMAVPRRLDDGPDPVPNVWGGVSIESDRYTFRADHLRQANLAVRFLSLEPLLGPLPSLDLTGIDWVIVGGESGHGARPMDPEWVRDIRDRCLDAGVAFFFKQWGSWLPYEEDPQPPFFTSPTGETVDGHCLPALLTDMEPCSGGSEPGTWWWPDVDYGTVFRRAGKHAAGRLLDGRTWDEMPAEAMA